MPLANLVSPAVPGEALLGKLGGLARGQGLADLGERLADLAELTAADMAETERDLALVDRPANVVAKSAHHLLDLGGKRLRPLCVALAARLGERGFDVAARALAVAVELVHSATLLHDDVVDLGDTRRGARAARAIWGNAASIYAGDWLLVDALRRVRQARVPGVLDRLLEVIEEMIFAEAVQLENRGRVGTRADYFRVVEGKTAALFRWAMHAGGRAGGLGDDACRALEGFGLHLGVAFQAVDDLLDFTGDAATLGKQPLADLREGKLTFPLLVALEREPALLAAVREIAAAPGDEPPPPPLCARVVAAVERTGGLDECRALARGRTQEAIACLAALPAGRARAALSTVAEATLGRNA